MAARTGGAMVWGTAVTWLGGVAMAASLAGPLENLWWALGLFAHFRLQYLVVLLLCAGLAWRLRRRWAAGLFAAGAVVNLLLILPLLRPEPAGPAPHLRVMMANVHRANARHDALLPVVRATDPDVLVLVEVDDGWLRDLRDLHAAYPYRLASPRDDNFGIALFSKRPLRQARILHLGAPLPSLAAEVDMDGRPLTVLGTHPMSPFSGQRAEMQRAQFQELARFAATARTPVLLVGDLNATPWSSLFQGLLAHGRLRNGGAGQGVLMTWPAPFPPLGIPIDHALHTRELIVTRLQTAPAIGSDHLPIVVDVAWRE